MALVRIIPCEINESGQCESVATHEEYREFMEDGGAYVQDSVARTVSERPMDYLSEDTSIAGESTEEIIAQYAWETYEQAFADSRVCDSRDCSFRIGGFHVEHRWDDGDIANIADRLREGRGKLRFATYCRTSEDLSFIVKVFDSLAYDSKGSKIAARIIDGISNYGRRSAVLTALINRSSSTAAQIIERMDDSAESSDVIAGVLYKIAYNPHGSPAADILASIGSPQRRVELLMALARKNPATAASVLAYLRGRLKSIQGSASVDELQSMLMQIAHYQGGAETDDNYAASKMLGYEAAIEEIDRNTEMGQPVLYALEKYYDSSKTPMDQQRLHDMLDYFGFTSYRLDFNESTGMIDNFQIYFSAEEVEFAQEESLREERILSPEQVARMEEKARRKALEDQYNMELSECAGKPVDYDYGESPDKQFAHLLETLCGIESEPAEPVLGEVEPEIDEGNLEPEDGLPLVDVNKEYLPAGPDGFVEGMDNYLEPVATVDIEGVKLGKEVEIAKEHRK